MTYLIEKFEKPYLAVTVRDETRDMSVGHMEKEDFYLSTDRLRDKSLTRRCFSLRRLYRGKGKR